MNKDILSNNKESNKPWHSRGWGVYIILMSVLTTLAVVGGIYLFVKNFQNKQPVQDDVSNLSAFIKGDQFIDVRQKVEDPNSPYVGSENAPLVIVEYGDFRCPQCRKQFSIIRQFVTENSDKVKLIYRHFPVVSDLSFDFSLVAVCAHKQDMFWQFHDNVYGLSNVPEQKDITLTANAAGLDIDRLNLCLKDRSIEEEVIYDAQSVFAYGAKGTPTFFVNGYMVEGVLSESVLNQFVEAIDESIEPDKIK